jgi:hypothetical protein
MIDTSGRNVSLSPSAAADLQSAVQNLLADGQVITAIQFAWQPLSPSPGFTGIPAGTVRGHFPSYGFGAGGPLPGVTGERRTGAPESHLVKRKGRQGSNKPKR